MTFAAGLFVLSYVVAYVRNQSWAFYGTAMVLTFLILIKALIVPSARAALRGRATVMISVLFAVALFNIIVAQNMETPLRWLLWLLIVVCLNRVVGAADGRWVNELIRRLPYMFFAIYLTLIVVARFIRDEEAIRFAYHLSGLYGNLILATGLFAGKLWQRLTWSAIGLVAIYLSGAGGALFTVPIMFVPYILYSTTSMPVKGMTVTTLLIIGGVFFFGSDLFGQFLDIKLNLDYSDNSASGLDRLEHSGDLRLQLVKFGWFLAQEHPLGTGLGHTYSDEILSTYNVSHVHNGTITMLVELGFPGFTAIFCLMAWMMWSILRSPHIENQLKGFYFTYFFTVFGRSLSENYTPFDLGNFFNYVFLIVSISLFLHLRVAQSSRRPAAHLAPPPGLMMPPMRPQPPLHAR